MTTLELVWLLLAIGFSCNFVIANYLDSKKKNFWRSLYTMLANLGTAMFWSVFFYEIFNGVLWQWAIAEFIIMMMGVALISWFEMKAAEKEEQEDARTRAIS